MKIIDKILIYLLSLFGHQSIAAFNRYQWQVELPRKAAAPSVPVVTVLLVRRRVALPAEAKEI